MFIPGGSAIPTTDYTLTNSLRFRSSASAFLNRTLTTPTNGRIWTWSAWIKRGALFATKPDQTLFGTQGSGAQGGILFNSSDFISFKYSGAIRRNAVAVLRDPSAWYHIVVAVDTTQASETNRALLYINGVQQTWTTSTSITQNDTTQINQAVAHNIGSNSGSAANEYFDGYMDEINFIDGQALTPSSFGSTNATTGVWQPARYTGTYGTNGFYLNFTNIALTSGSNTGLGQDFSGNGNFWNTTNISVTAGTTYDAMLDVPTLTSATTANYATLNPLMAGAPFQTNAAATVSQGNLQADWGTTSQGSLLSTIAMTSGKWYFEGTVTGTNTREVIGIVNSSAATTTYAGGDANGWGYFSVNGNKYNNGSATSYGATYTTNDIIGVAFDADAGSLTFYKNNVSQGTAFTGLASGTYFFAVSDANSSLACGWNVNFGQRPFAYTPPTGFNRLNAFNLPTSTIVKGNTVMDATLYTGTGSALTVTNAGSFRPDFVWSKNRSAGDSSGLYDSVRGVNQRLISNLTNAEDTSSGVSAFNSNGFSLGTAANYNTNGNSFVAWQWQAGQGSTSSNTSGSITSTVSVNTTAGFSIVTYTGTGANATVGHGLGVAPKMVIVKNRSIASSWRVWFTGFAGTELINLNETVGKETGQTATWNSTVPTSTVFSLGTAAAINGNGNNLVAYLWSEIAGFSRFGSYTGNGSADGPFVFTNFRPKYIMVKRTNSTGNWYVWDSVRSPSNVVNRELYPNLSNAEATTGPRIDIVANGFKFRDSDVEFNGSGSTYIYAAFAENPFKNALAR